MLSWRPPWSSAIAAFSALVIILHLPNVGLLSHLFHRRLPLFFPWFLLLQARTFANKVSFPMGIFALYTTFTTYAVTRRRPPFPSIPNE
jgi:hypothetical protein